MSFAARMETADFHRAQTDKKEYRLFTLANGLEVLLVSDKSEPADVSDSEDDEGDSESFVTEEDDMSMGSKHTLDSKQTIDDHAHHTRGIGGCAVAMAVGVGSFDEDLANEPQGLAHLLEHMLFMGSEKYPKENAYDDFLSKNGGYSNAYTEAECTVYYFEVPHPGLRNAIDIFAQFFTAPLMLKDSLAREINAVDSEFDTVRGDDDLRIRALWRLGTVSPSHPYAGFSWGNAKSLLRHQDKKDLREMLQEFYTKHYHVGNMKLVVWSIDELDALEEIVQESFGFILPNPQAKSISLSSDPIPLPFSAETCLGKVFKIIPVNDVHILRLTWQHSPLRTYKSRPAAYVSHLLGHESEGGILSYLKNEGWASELWAGTSEDDGHENSTVCSMFSVEVKLTKSGVENYYKVIASVFAYLGMLRSVGPQRWVFDEIQKATEAAFAYKDEGDPSSEVCDYAVKMLKKSNIFDRKDLLRADQLLFDFVPDDINTLMDSLGCQGNKAPRIDLASSLFGREFQFANNLEGKANGADFEIEEYWGTRYSVERIPDEEFSRICDALEKGAAFDTQMKFGMPPHNSYIPVELNIHPLRSERVRKDAMRAIHPLVGSEIEIQTQVNKKLVWLPAKVDFGRKFEDGRVALRVDYELGDKPVWLESQTSPEVVGHPSIHVFNEGKTKVRVIKPSLPLHPELVRGCANPNLRLWWLQDSIFSVPRSGMYVIIRCPEVNMSLESRALSEIVVSLTTHVLDHEAYLAKMAELDVTFKVYDEGFVVSVFGFSEKLQQLVERSIDTLVQFASGDWQGIENLEQVFHLERETLIRHLLNAETEPDIQANNLRLCALVPGTLSKKELANVLKENFKNFSDIKRANLLRQSRVEVLYHGNVRLEDANKACMYFNKKVPRKPIVPQSPRAQVVNIPKGTLCAFVLPSDEPSEKTSAIHLYYELCEDLPQYQAVGEMLELLMEEPLFDELRTKQQLGYIVSCGLRRTHGMLGLAVELTSSKFTPTECLSRFEKFLIDFREELLCISDGELRKRAEGLARRNLQKDAGIFQETKRHWGAIFEQTYRFNEKWLVAHEILHAPKSNGKFGVSIQDVIRFFDAKLGISNRRALLVIIVGGGNTLSTNVEKEKQNLPRGTTCFNSAQEFWEAYPERVTFSGRIVDSVVSSISGSSAVQ